MCFSNKNWKRFFFVWYIAQRSPVFLLTKQNILWVLWILKLEAWTREKKKLKNSGTSNTDFTYVIEGLRLFEATPTNPFFYRSWFSALSVQKLCWLGKTGNTHCFQLTVSLFKLAQTSPNSPQTHQNIFSINYNVKNVTHVAKCCKGCSKKANTEASVT